MVTDATSVTFPDSAAELCWSMSVAAHTSFTIRRGSAPDVTSADLAYGTVRRRRAADRCL